MLNKDYTARLLNLENVIITNVENHVRFVGKYRYSCSLL